MGLFSKKKQAPAPVPEPVPEPEIKPRTRKFSVNVSDDEVAKINELLKSASKEGAGGAGALGR